MSDVVTPTVATFQMQPGMAAAFEEAKMAILGAFAHHDLSVEDAVIIQSLLLGASALQADPEDRQAVRNVAIANLDYVLKPDEAPTLITEFVPFAPGADVRLLTAALKIMAAEPLSAFQAPAVLGEVAGNILGSAPPHLRRQTDAIYKFHFADSYKQAAASSDQQAAVEAAEAEAGTSAL